MNDRRLSDRRRCRYYRGIAPDGTELTWGSYNATAYQAYMYITRHAGKWFANAVRDEPESGDRWRAGQWIACRRNYKLYIREGMLFEHIADGKVYKVFAVRRDVICYGEPNLAGTEYKTPTDSFHDIVKRVVSNRFFDDEY